MHHTYDVEEIVINLHLLPQLTPDLLHGQLIICVNEAVQPDDMEVSGMLLA